MKNTFEYKGITFSEGTPIKTCDKLIELYNSKERIILDYGDIKTNKSWNEVHDITGRISKSTGAKPILILIYNRRSYGGGAILTNCILNIKTSKGKIVLFEN